jgi:purine-binding chemotaxis protein CheW
LLIARIGDLICALPIASVVETMRPLPIEPLGDAAEYVLGVAIIRGAPTIVVDTARLLGHRTSSPPRRYVVVRSGSHPLALTFDDVIGVRRIAAASLADLPPLLREVTPHAVAKIGRTDANIVLLLESALVVSAELLAQVAATT